MTIVDKLTKERYALKDTNPIRSNTVIPILLSEAKSVAKTAGREVMEEDIQAVAKSYVKKLEPQLELYKDNDIALAKVTKEIEEFRSFLPHMLTEEGTRSYLASILGLVKIPTSEMGKILKSLPKDVDRGIASRIIKEFM